MLIYPTIELQNSKPVSLYRGNLDEPQIWHVNPLEKALEFARAGAEWIHITDFDAIADQGNSNNDLIENMIAEVLHLFKLGVVSVPCSVLRNGLKLEQEGWF
jgi:phosphoribosylformimino-5-aminoimidazole carboxamide ribotide isomerase